MNNVDIKNYTSRWDYMADRAGVSRKPLHSDEPTQFQIVGRFVGDWRQELDSLIKKYNGGHTFNFLTKMGPGTDPYTYKLDLSDMQAAGIPTDAKFVHRIGPKQMRESFAEIPTIKKMIDWFGFTGLILPKIHIQKPGQIFPFHFDDLTTHRGNSGGESILDKEPNRCARIEVQLLDWDFGHVWGIGNNYWSNWQAGEIMWHPWYNVPHGTANTGMSPRINLQITGETTPELLEKLQRNNGDIIL
jgi:hypothetical protein